MKVFFLGAYSAAGMQGMMSSNYDTRVSAVKQMVEKVGGKLGNVTYLQGPFDVIADVELDDYETASGLHANMMLSGGWDELLILPEMNVDKAIKAARTAGDYPMPGQEQNESTSPITLKQDDGVLGPHCRLDHILFCRFSRGHHPLK